MAFSEEEKVKILLQEYASLRSEILTRINNMYQLIAISAALVIWITRQSMSVGFSVAFVAGVVAAVIVVAFFFWTISRDIAKAARRLRELEKDINCRAGETLLVWETQWGGAVVGYWLGTKPLPSD